MSQPEGGKWTEQRAVEFLKRQGVLPMGKEIEAKNVGCGTWGAIDFLVHECGYTRVKEARY